MSCSAVYDLLPAFVLGALPGDELRDVGVHLANCGRHPEASSLRTTAVALSLAAEEREPPARLLNRILGRIATDEVAALPVVARQRALAERRIPRWAPVGVLTALLLMVVGLSQTGVAFRGGNETVVRTASTGTIEGRLAYIPSQRVAVLTLTNVEAPPSDRDYQTWIIRAGQLPAQAGIMRVEGGTARVTIETVLNKGDVLAVTVEPTGGSNQPTSQPFFTAPF